MKIFSGTDLLYLARESLWNDDGTSPLVVLCVTDDYHFSGVHTVDKHFSGRLDDYQDALLKAADRNGVRYFAVAHETMRREILDFEYEAARRLEQAAAKIGLFMISEFAVGRTTWASTGLMHRFTYSLDDDEPKSKRRTATSTRK